MQEDALLPSLQLVANIGKDFFLVEDRAAESLPLLRPIVVEQTEGITPKQENSQEIEGSHQRHKKICYRPNGIKACQRAEDNHSCRAKAIDANEKPL